MNEQKQLQPSALKSFIDQIKTVTPEDLKNDDTVASLADSLSRVGLEPELNEDEKLKVHRDEKALIRKIAGPAFELVRQEAEGDPLLQQELEENVLTGLASAGIPRDTIPGYESNRRRERPAVSATEYNPTVREEDERFLTGIVDRIDTQHGVWRDKDTKEFAQGFLDIYYPSQEKLTTKRGRSGQEVVDAIAACNIYSHSLASALAQVPEKQRTLTVNRVQESMLTSLKHAALASEGTASITLFEAIESGNVDKIPEVRAFIESVRGARLESVAHEELSSSKEKMGLTSVEFASLEDDIKGGYDLVVTDESGETFYIDIKSRGSFRNLINESRNIELLSTNEGVAIKKSRYVGADGRPLEVIVINIIEAGYGERDTNKFSLETPDSYLQAVTDGMMAVKTTTSQ